MTPEQRAKVDAFVKDVQAAIDTLAIKHGMTYRRVAATLQSPDEEYIYCQVNIDAKYAIKK